MQPYKRKAVLEQLRRCRGGNARYLFEIVRGLWHHRRRVHEEHVALDDGRARARSPPTTRRRPGPTTRRTTAASTC